MPRTSRGSGGSRQGQPGKAYSNRTDLTAAKVPMAAPTGQPYGQAKAQIDAQRVVPMASAPGPSPASGPPPEPVPLAGHAPGAMGDFLRPTERPHEPLTHGLPTGPGGGPEVLPQQLGGGTLSDVIANLARTTGSADMQFLAQRAQQVGQ